MQAMAFLARACASVNVRPWLNAASGLNGNAVVSARKSFDPNVFVTVDAISSP